VSFDWVDVAWLILWIALLVAFITIVVLGLTYLERKFLARIQQRLGPMRTGPWGLLQPIADAIKLLLKEDILPAMTDKAIYWLAPLVVFVPAFIIWVSIPFTQDIVVRNLELGIFYILAVSGVSIVGLVMAGLGSSNKYALLGGLRAAAQLISYEVPLIVVVIAIVMMSQSLNLKTIVIDQDPIWYVLLQPLGLLIFLLAGLAEVGRAPFDIPFAESEVIGGPFVEYSGIHWSIFFLAEYTNTLAVAVLATVLFLGGWHGPLFGADAAWAVNLLQALWFALKTLGIILAIFWIRATVPRFRIDQLMGFAWKILLPLSFLNVLLTGIYLFYGWPRWSMGLMSLGVMLVVIYQLMWRRQRSLKRSQALRLARGKALR